MGDKFLDAMSKDLGMPTAEEIGEAMGWASTGNYALNWAVSNRFASRGWPLGQVVEIYGAPGTGKTFLLLRAIAELQRAGGVALFDDAENRLNSNWAKRKLGVDTAKLLVQDSGTIEEHWDFLKAIIDHYRGTDEDRPLLAVLDSLGVLSTEHEMDKEFEKRDMTRAQNIHKLFRMLTKRVRGLPICYIAANHTYDKIGASPWEKGEVSKGGGGFKYQASVRVSMRTTKNVKGDVDLAGVVIRAVIEKNSVTIPYRETSMLIPFDRPIAPHSGLIPTLLDLGYLETTGNHKLVWQGEDTGIPAHKSDKHLIKQDESGGELLEKYPDLLEVVDADLKRREEGTPEEAAE